MKAVIIIGLAVIGLVYCIISFVQLFKEKKEKQKKDENIVQVEEDKDNDIS